MAPAFTLYLWALVGAGQIGWALVLLLCICCALRLARFNTAEDEDEGPAWSRNFFVGVPSPAGAGLALFPLVLWFQTDAEFLRHPLIVGSFMLATSLLLVSRVRTFTFKKVRIAQSWVLPTMLGVGLYLALLFSAIWPTLTLTLAAYIASIPFSVRLYHRNIREARAREATPASESGV